MILTCPVSMMLQGGKRKKNSASDQERDGGVPGVFPLSRPSRARSGEGGREKRKKKKKNPERCIERKRRTLSPPPYSRTRMQNGRQGTPVYVYNRGNKDIREGKMKSYQHHVGRPHGGGWKTHLLSSHEEGKNKTPSERSLGQLALRPPCRSSGATGKRG